MALNAIERLFVGDWKAKDFSTWREADIREDFIAPLLRVLGYSKGTVADVLREVGVRLSNPYHRLGRQRIEIDYLPSVRLKGFWVLEAKPGAPRDMGFGDLLQAHLYAIHPEINAQLIVLANGWSVRVYDALELRDWEDPLLVCTQENCDSSFERLRDALGARALLSFQRNRLLERARDILSVEIDGGELEEFARRSTSLVASLRPVVAENAKRFQITAFETQRRADAEELGKATIDSLISVHMDIPIDTDLRPAVELVRRIEDSSLAERASIVQKVLMGCHGRPHAIRRVQSVYVLRDIVTLGIEVPASDFLPEMGQALEELVVRNARYWDHDALANALCHLENGSLRLAKKIVNRFRGAVERTISRLAAAMSAEDRLALRLRPAQAVAVLAGLLGEVLWRKYCASSSAEDVWNGVWRYQTIEAVIDSITDVVTTMGADRDLLWLEHYGRGYDMLRFGTWCLVKESPLASRLTCEARAFALLSHEAVLKSIPAPKPHPATWSESDIRARAEAWIADLSSGVDISTDWA
jgi:hypothetical protein